MDTKMINLTYEVADEIKESDTYKRLLDLKKVIDTDHEIQELIKAFDKQKTKYEEVSKYGKYHPDLKKVQLDLASVKEKLFTNQKISEYKQLERDLQKILNRVSKEIAQSVSSKIKHPNDEGLIPKH